MKFVTIFELITLLFKNLNNIKQKKTHKKVIHIFFDLYEGES